MVQQAVVVPPFERQKLASSSLILSNAIRTLEKVPEEDEMFVLGDVKIYPQIENRFSRDKPLGVYLQLYNAALDPSTQAPALQVAYRIKKEGRVVAETMDEEGRSIWDVSPSRLVLIEVLSLGHLEPGEYQLEVEARDRITGQTLQIGNPLRLVADGSRVAMGR